MNCTTAMYVDLRLHIVFLIYWNSYSACKWITTRKKLFITKEAMVLSTHYL